MQSKIKKQAANLVVLRTPEEILSLVDFYSGYELIAYDTETTGLEMDCEVVGASFCATRTIAHYCVMSYWDPETKQLIRLKENKEALRKVIELIKLKNLIMHNAVYDCRVTWVEFGIQLIQSVFADTMVMAHLLDEEGPQGLKELGRIVFGETATQEQQEMKASVIKNGGIWEDKKKKGAIKEMYKADPEILGKYGAKDTVLTFDLFYELFDRLTEEGLSDFFFEDECMPLLREATYDLNTVGLRVDVTKMRTLEKEMEHKVNRLIIEIEEDLAPYMKERPTFKISSTQQMAWLLFVRLQQPFRSLNDSGRALAKQLTGKLPYTPAQKRSFIHAVDDERRRTIGLAEQAERSIAPVLGALKAELEEARKIRNKIKREDPSLAPEAEAIIDEIIERIDALQLPAKTYRKRAAMLFPEKYIQVDKATLQDLSSKFEWIQKLLSLRSEEKLLGTYVRGILSRQRYGIVYPEFRQTGTDSGRYSSSNPNFQNLPRDDKRVKSCVIARPGRTFVGADYSQLEPRVFASISQDPRLIECFERGEDFYSVVGVEIFGRQGASTYKDDEGSFATAHKSERQVSKAVCLASAYGTTANKQAQVLRHANGKPFTTEECEHIINTYFERFPGVRKMMLESHKMAKRDGKVYNLYGRPRRLPLAVKVGKMFPNISHAELEYIYRQPLNLAMNFRVQSSAASIVNRACIAFKRKCREKYAQTGDAAWLTVYIIMQVHDEIIADCDDHLVPEVKALLKESMETTTILPGVALVAEPVAAKILSELK